MQPRTPHTQPKHVVNVDFRSHVIAAVTQLGLAAAMSTPSPKDGPLDLRFNTSKGVPAHEFLTNVCCG